MKYINFGDSAIENIFDSSIPTIVLSEKIAGEYSRNKIFCCKSIDNDNFSLSNEKSIINTNNITDESSESKQKILSSYALSGVKDSLDEFIEESLGNITSLQKFNSKIEQDSPTNIIFYNSNNGSAIYTANTTYFNNNVGCYIIDEYLEPSDPLPDISSIVQKYIPGYGIIRRYGDSSIKILKAYHSGGTYSWVTVKTYLTTLDFLNDTVYIFYRNKGVTGVGDSLYKNKKIYTTTQFYNFVNSLGDNPTFNNFTYYSGGGNALPSLPSSQYPNGTGYIKYVTTTSWELYFSSGSNWTTNKLTLSPADKLIYYTSDTQYVNSYKTIVSSLSQAENDKLTIIKNKTPLI